MGGRERISEKDIAEWIKQVEDDTSPKEVASNPKTQNRRPSRMTNATIDAAMRRLTATILYRPPTTFRLRMRACRHPFVAARPASSAADPRSWPVAARNPAVRLDPASLRACPRSNYCSTTSSRQCASRTNVAGWDRLRLWVLLPFDLLRLEAPHPRNQCCAHPSVPDVSRELACAIGRPRRECKIPARPRSWPRPRPINLRGALGCFHLAWADHHRLPFADVDATVTLVRPMWQPDRRAKCLHALAHFDYPLTIVRRGFPANAKVDELIGPFFWSR